MKTSLTILFFALQFAPGYSQNFALYKKDFKQDYITRRYSRNQVASDIKFMLKVTKKLHPNFYHNFTRQKLKTSVDNILKSLPDSMDIYKSSLAMSEIMSMFNEGHLGLLGNEETFKYFRDSPNKFPYSIYYISDSALIVNKDFSEETKLTVYDSILSINDIPVYSLAKKFKKYFGGLNEWRVRQLRYQFDYILFASGIVAPFKIKAKHKGEDVEYVTGGSLKPIPNSSGTQKRNYNFSIIDNDIAYINFYSMFDFKAFSDSIKITFQEIASKNINNLIIDLRYNGGGNSMLGKHLLTYVNDKPYRMIASMKIKVSKPLKQYYRVTSLTRNYKAVSYLVPNGICWTKNMKITKEPISEPFFKGNVVFLIGSGTFSSANLLANGVQDFGLATLIGDSTSEPCNEYGDMLPFMLPNTQLMARSPFKYFVRANGDKADMNGVIPTYLVKPSMNDVIQGNDKVLDYAKKFLRKG